jgi:hypothetical protein
VVAVTGTSAIEAVEANIEAGRVVLSAPSAVGATQISEWELTMESKHCVQSSLYTDCVDPGARSSNSCKYNRPAEGKCGVLTRRVDVRASHC